MAKVGTMKIINALNKTLHLTGLGLAVQAFYINLTLDSVLGGEYLELRPVGPTVVNPASVWDINGVPAIPAAYDRRAAVGRVGTAQNVAGTNYDANGFRDQNGFYHDNAGLKNGYDVGRTYGGGQDYGLTTVQGNAFGDINGRNKGHQVAGFATNYQKNESGNKATYYDDGLGHGGVVQYGLKDARARDGKGNAYGGGYHDSSLKANALGNQGQYGNAGGYRGGDIRGSNVGNVDVYRANAPGLVPLAGPAPLPVPVVYQRPALLPVAAPAPYHIVQPNVGRVPVPANPYVIPAPNKLYYDRPVVG